MQTPRGTPASSAPQGRPDIAALRATQQELNNQVNQLITQQERLQGTREHAATTGDREQLVATDQRLAQINQRIASIEQQRMTVDQAIADEMARGLEQGLAKGLAEGLANSGTQQRSTTAIQRAREFASDNAVPLLLVEALMFVLGGIVLWQAATRRGRQLLRSLASPDSMSRLQQSVDAMALEVERISENQRFVTKLLNERAEPRAAMPVAPAELERKV